MFEKDTSERVARRCDDTVDKKRANSSVLKHLFVERVEQPKISPKNPGNALSDVLLMSCFQNFAADAAKNELRSARFFKTVLRAILINSLIRGQWIWEVVIFTDLDLTLLYISLLGTNSKFVRKNEMLALGVCLLQPCPSAGRRCAATRSRLNH